MYRAYNDYFTQDFDTQEEAEHFARLNSCAVRNLDTWKIIADYR